MTSFGWAAPPRNTADARHRRPLPGAHPAARRPGLYGYVTRHALVGNNPTRPGTTATPIASCMVLNQNFDAVPRHAADRDARHGGARVQPFAAVRLRRAHRSDDGSGRRGSRAAPRGWRTRSSTRSNDNYNYLWPDLREADAAVRTRRSPTPTGWSFRAMTEPLAARARRTAASGSSATSGSSSAGTPPRTRTPSRRAFTSVGSTLADGLPRRRDRPAVRRCRATAPTARALLPEGGTGLLSRGPAAPTTVTSASRRPSPATSRTTSRPFGWACRPPGPIRCR